MKAVRQHIKSLLFFLACILLSCTFSVPSASAQGNATIQFSPSSGSFSNDFNVSLVVNGGGERFNAAQATVTVPSGISIQNLTLGNCNFSFLTTPSIANPSFAGVILGGSSAKCTVYTLALAPVQKGNGSIILSKGSVRRYGDAVNILSSMQNGNYTLTNTVKITPQPTIATPKTGLYTLVLTVTDSATGARVKNTLVTIHSVVTKTSMQKTTDMEGRVQFENIKQGIYDTTVQGYSGDTILNVTGRNHILILSIQVKKQSSLNTLLPYVGILGIGILVGGGIVVVLLRIKH